jgi:peptide/nickel transport system substrate-binding protein
MITRRRFIAGAASGGAVALVRPSRGVAQTAPALAKRGGTLAVAIFADPLSFDPALSANVQGRTACRALHDTLFTVDEAGRLAPGLVESWEQPDDKTFLLKLRQNVKFQDGTPFDAAAVKFNIDRLGDPSLGSIRGGEIRTLDKLEVVDALTVKMTLKYPFAAFLFPFTDVTGCIGSPTALQKLGRDYALHPVGAGPFKLVEYAKDSRTVLERNPDYWDGGKPHLDQVVLRPIPTDSTRLAELRSGGVQIAEALPLQNIRQLRESKEIVVSEKVGFRWEYFGFNCHDEFPGKAKKFRQAFQWAIDREALHQAAYFGTGSIGYDGILPGSPFHDPAYKPFQRDMEKAKRLIDESGVTLPVTIRSPLQPDPVKQRAAQVFQATVAELGVTVQIEQVDTAGYDAALRSGKMAMDLQGWWGYRPDPDQYLAILCHSSGSYAQYHGYNNPARDEHIVAERSARSEAERRQVFRQVVDLMNEDAVYVPWHYGSDFKGLHPKVKGFVHPQDAIIKFQNLWLES